MINYSLAAMVNPQKRNEPAKYYAKAQMLRRVEIDELAREVAAASALTEGDVLSAIRSFVALIRKHVANSEIVSLENLGSFQAQLSSEGAESEEKFTQANITKVRLQFRPGRGLQELLAPGVMQFQKVAPRPKDEDPDEETEEEEETL